MSVTFEESRQMRDLVAAHRCLRCGKEDKVERGGWSSCFTVCDDCWGKPVDDALRRTRSGHRNSSGGEMNNRTPTPRPREEPNAK